LSDLKSSISEKSAAENPIAPANNKKMAADAAPLEKFAAKPPLFDTKKTEIEDYLPTKLNY